MSDKKTPADSDNSVSNDSVTADAVSDDITSNVAAKKNADEIELRDDAISEIDDAKSTPEDRETAGPFDASEVPTMRPYVDLGGIKVAPREGLQLRLEVDERNKRVVAVSLEFEGSLLQVQAFAAPKKSGLWGQVRAELTQQMTGQGSKVSEEAGTLGPELLVQTPVKTEQGSGVRVVRFIAVDGPRWLLRGAIMGKAAIDADAREQVVELFREIVVVRGDQPMPPSELIALKVPAGVQGANPGENQSESQQA